MRGEIVELERLRRLSPEAGPAESYGFYLAAGGLYETSDRTDAETAVAFAERAVALDPRFSRGWLMVGWCRHALGTHGWAPGESPEQEAARFRRAAELAPRDGLPLGFLALSRAKAGARTEAVRLIERALDLGRATPDVAVELSLGVIGVTGQPERALSLVSAALDHCPTPPSTWRYMEGRAAFFAGDAERALRATDLAPGSVPTLVFRVLAATELGDIDVARICWARLRTIAPGFDFDLYARSLPIAHEAMRSRYDSAVRKLFAHLAAAAEGGLAGQARSTLA